MNEKELFNEVLRYFMDTYPEIEVRRPNDNGYLEFYLGSECLGSFNSDWLNLLRSLKELCNIFEKVG